MSIIDFLYDRIQKYERLHNKSPQILLMTQDELNELMMISEQSRGSWEALVYDLAKLDMRTDMIVPEQISNILEVLDDGQLAILLIHPDAKTRQLAQQEIKNRKAKK